MKVINSSVLFRQGLFIGFDIGMRRRYSRYSVGPGAGIRQPHKAFRPAWPNKLLGKGWNDTSGQLFILLANLGDCFEGSLGKSTSIKTKYFSASLAKVSSEKTYFHLYAENAPVEPEKLISKSYSPFGQLLSPLQNRYQRTPSKEPSKKGFSAVFPQKQNQRGLILSGQERGLRQAGRFFLHPMLKIANPATATRIAKPARVCVFICFFISSIRLILGGTALLGQITQNYTLGKSQKVPIQFQNSNYQSWDSWDFAANGYFPSISGLIFQSQYNIIWRMIFSVQDKRDFPMEILALIGQWEWSSSWLSQSFCSADGCRRLPQCRQKYHRFKRNQGIWGPDPQGNRGSRQNYWQKPGEEKNNTL